MFPHVSGVQSSLVFDGIAAHNEYSAMGINCINYHYFLVISVTKKG
jgi:hypothetical protein